MVLILLRLGVLFEIPHAAPPRPFQTAALPPPDLPADELPSPAAQQLRPGAWITSPMYQCFVVIHRDHRSLPVIMCHPSFCIYDDKTWHMFFLNRLVSAGARTIDTLHTHIHSSH